MIAAPRTAFRPAGSPVWRPSRAPSYAGGKSLPTTAAYLDRVPLTVPASTVAPAGVVGDFSFGAWLKIIERLDQYVTFFCLQKTSAVGENGSYFWFGYDSAAGGGARGLAVYGNNGAHSYDLLPAAGTWFHAAVTKQGNTVRAFLNGVLCDWDTAAPDTDFTMDIGNASYDEINRATICRELDAGDVDETRIAVRAAWFQAARTPDADIAALMQRSDPRNAPGVTIDGSWPLTSGSDFSDTAGGIGALTGTASTQADAPEGIILP